MENTQVYKLIMSIANKLGRPEKDMINYAERIILDNWLDTIESLRGLNEQDWIRLNIPLRLSNEIKEFLSNNYEIKETTNSQNTIIDPSNEHSLNSFNQNSDPEPRNTHTSTLLENNKATPPESSNYSVQASKEAPPEPQNNFSQDIKGNIQDLTAYDLYEHDDTIFPISLYESSEKIESELSSNPQLIKTVKTLLTIVNNILAKPDCPTRRKIKKENKVFNEQVGRFQFAKDALFACGFIEDDEFLKLPIAYISRLTDFHYVLFKILKEKGENPAPIPKGTVFNPYLTLYNFTSTNSRKSHALVNSHTNDNLESTVKKVNNRKKMLETGGFVELVPLDPKIYHQNQIKTSSTQSISSYNSYETAFAANPNSQFKIHALEEPDFSSRLKKELHSLEKQKVYSMSTLRILFPDKMVLELHFKPDTTFREIFTAIERFLLPNIKSQEWTVYESPPKKYFAPHNTLYSENLVPGGMLHFSLKETSEVNAKHDSFLDPASIS